VEYHVFQVCYPATALSLLQIELAESGTKHVQGFICTERRVRLSTVKKWLGVVAPGTTGRAHVEAIFEASTPTQAAAYCKDPAKRHPDYRDFLFEKGVLQLIVRRSASSACWGTELVTHGPALSQN